MSSVQRIARLKSNHCVPALLRQFGANFARCQHVLSERSIFRLRQRLERAPDQVCHFFVVDRDHLSAGMVRAVRAVHALDVRGLVPWKDIVDLNGRHDFTVSGGECDLLPADTCPARASSIGKAMGIVHAYFAPLESIVDSSST